MKWSHYGSLGLSQYKGEITEIKKGSPADHSRLRVGDFIFSINGNSYWMEILEKKHLDNFEDFERKLLTKEARASGSAHVTLGLLAIVRSNSSASKYLMNENFLCMISKSRIFKI